MQRTKLNYREMMDIARGLIGREAEIIKSNDRSLLGLKGQIIDETLNTLVILTENGRKTIPKNVVTLKIWLPSGVATVEGKEIIQRPEERIKKWWRKIKKVKRNGNKDKGS